MLRTRQIWILVALSAAFWVVATLYLKLLPGAFVDPVRGAISFATAIPIGWLWVLLTKRAAGLSSVQLLPGVSIVGAIAMMIDGVVLRWAPQIYGSSDTVIRYGAAWLLWGYGVSFAIALFLVARRRDGARPTN